jgi:LCP family protein required for cell wall assembly
MVFGGENSRAGIVAADDATLPSALPSPKRGRRRRRKILYILMAALMVVALATAGYIYNLGQIYDSKTTKIENAFPDESLRPPKRDASSGSSGNAGEAVVPVAPGGGPGPGAGVVPGAGSGGGPVVNVAGSVNILLVGSDSRGAALGDAAAGSGSNQRSDTIMLLHLPADRSKVYSISLMRDLWVNIPGHGNAKINAAMAFGGVPLMVQTIETLFWQRIDHVVMIDFEGFKDVTDALGGVEVDITRPFSSYHDHLQFAAGPTVLDGEHALAFVRERYAYADGDYQRVRNQQAFLRGVLAKLLSAGTLANPLTVHNVVSATSPYVSVDAGLDSATLAGLAFSLRELRKDDVVLFTLPTAGVGTSADGQSIVLPEWQAIRSLGSALGRNTLAEYVAARRLQGGN